MIGTSWRSPTPQLMILDTREAILCLRAALEALAERCGQAGAMHWLPYFLDRAVTRRRTPVLVLSLRPERSPDSSLCADDLEAAAMFFEYRIFGLHTRAVTTADTVGFTSVIAPPGERTRVAAMAARALVGCGAAIVMATCERDWQPGTLPDLATVPGSRFALRERSVGRTLRLESSLDATLAQMGKSTRFNLRYYRRRLEREGGCEYVADAAPALRGLDLQALNAAALNPVAPDEFERRVRCATELPGSFLSGLRAPDGRWLSLVGGWRQAETVVLHWQMNTAGFEKHSISTVMRSFLLEHEIGRGARTLLIYGGTGHSMRHAFQKDVVLDLLVQRRGLQGVALRWASRFFAAPDGLTGRSNFLASLLQDGEIEWRTVGSPKPERRFTGKLMASIPGPFSPSET